MATIVGIKSGIIEGFDYNTSLEPLGKAGSTGINYFAWTLNEANAQISALTANGWKCELNREGNGYHITATLNYNQDQQDPEQEPENQWSLTRNLEDINLLESDEPSVKFLTTTTKTNILNRLKNPLSKQPLWEKAKSTDSTYMSVANEVYTLMSLGTRTKRIITKTLKRSVTVPETYSSTWLLESEGKIMTTPTMISRFGIPAHVSVLMPNPNPSKIWLNEADGDVTNDVEVLYGWLDLGVDRVFSSKGNIQLSHEWVYNKWSTIAYTIFGQS